MKLETGTPNWRQYVKDKNLNITDATPNEVCYMKENYGIYYMEAHEFQSLHHYENGKPKPFRDNDPKSSYWNSCPSIFCAFLHEKKIYKCAALGTLHSFLDRLNSLDDPEWQPYLKYEPVDLISSDEKKLQHFADTHYCHISECAMCPANHNSVPQDKINVLPSYKK